MLLVKTRRGRFWCGATGVEDVQAACQVHRQRKIKILLGAGGDHRGEVEDREGVARDERAHRLAVGDIAGDQRDPLVAEAGGRLFGHDGIEEDHLVDPLLLAGGAGQRAPVEQCPRQSQPEKAQPPRNHHLHAFSPSAGSASVRNISYWQGAPVCG